MKLAKRPAGSKVEMQMTPMIDMVFQLLIYFLFTFKIVAQEGDFNIQMPKEADRPPKERFLPFVVRLSADEAGNLRQIVTPARTLNVVAGDRDSARNAYRVLLAEVKDFLGQETGPGSLRDKAEAKVSADFNLHYKYVIDAITQLSGYREPDGQLVRLFGNIQFEPPKPSQ
jgi:biopolymer transport protein ExbD